MEVSDRLRARVRLVALEVGVQPEVGSAQLSVVLPQVLVDWVAARAVQGDQQIRQVVDGAVARFAARPEAHRAAVLGEVGVWDEEPLPQRHVCWRVAPSTRRQLRAWQHDALAAGGRWTLRELTLAALSDLFLEASQSG